MSEFLSSIGQWKILLNIALLLMALFLSHFLVKTILSKFFQHVSRKLPKFVRDMLTDQGLFRRLSTFVPIIIFYYWLSHYSELPETLVQIFQKTTVVAAIVLIMNTLAFLTAKTSEVYSRFPIARSRPIKGYLQVLTIFIYFVGILLCLAAIFDRSPLVFLSGLGALTAIILLIFRDSILSLVAGVQLTANNLIEVGDWIEMPQFGADGDVVDIALNTVKVQNWDKTITVIPTHKFLEHSFKNWRAMQESGGRRIKRSINIDVQSVRFLDDQERARLEKFDLLKDYFAKKSQELLEYNKRFAGQPGLEFNQRRLTNLGTFRIYIYNYLKQNPFIHKDMPLLVRQLQPESSGLPVEIYVFVNDIAWENYENIQSDIFDHILAIAKEFEIRIFQNPSGSDFRALSFPSVLDSGDSYPMD